MIWIATAVYLGVLIATVLGMRILWLFLARPLINLARRVDRSVTRVWSTLGPQNHQVTTWHHEQE